MASKISLASLLLVMLLALWESKLTSSEEGVPDLNTSRLEDPNKDQDNADGQDGDEVEVGNYKQQGISGRARGGRSSKRCGPDVTHWLVHQMNHNKDHHVIRRCGSWAGSWIWPWCLREFANLVGNGRPWDFKNTQSFHRGSCPHRCPKTVTLCNQCVFHDVPGNIHYGYVGRAAAFQRMLLQFAAHRVQKGGIDDPKDQNAIRIGMDLWDHPDRRDHFCHEVHKHSLNKIHTHGCHICSTRY